jgi:hypothetical protein
MLVINAYASNLVHTMPVRNNPTVSDMCIVKNLESQMILKGRKQHALNRIAKIR